MSDDHDDYVGEDGHDEEAGTALVVRPTESPRTPAQSRVDAVASLTFRAYERASTLQLTTEEIAALQAEFPDDAFRPGAAGKEALIYIEHAFLRERLNKVIGIGQWALIPRNRWAEEGAKGTIVYVEAMLLVRGCFVSEAVGDMTYYPSNAQTNYGDAVEGAKTQALRRCCFDSETEVLTDRGFRRFQDVGDARVLQVNGSSLEPTGARPFQQDYSGQMIACYGQNLDFCVTPGHDMVTTEGKLKAATLIQTWKERVIPRCLTVSTSNDPRMKLAGYVLADGTIRNKKTWAISVSRPRKIHDLEALSLHSRELAYKTAGDVAVTDSGYTFKTRRDKRAFIYPMEMLADVLTPKKQIRRDCLLSLTASQAKAIVDGWMEFDGSPISEHSHRAYCSNVERLESLEVLAVMAGYCVSQRTARVNTLISDRPNYSVTISSRNGMHISKRNGRTVANSTDSVWCVTVPTGVIVVRRKGFSMLCGNCKEFGIGLQAWSKSWCEGWWQRRNAPKQKPAPATQQSHANGAAQEQKAPPPAEDPHSKIMVVQSLLKLDEWIKWVNAEPKRQPFAEAIRDRAGQLILSAASLAPNMAAANDAEEQLYAPKWNLLGTAHERDIRAALKTKRATFPKVKA